LAIDWNLASNTDSPFFNKLQLAAALQQKPLWPLYFAPKTVPYPQEVKRLAAACPDPEGC
jgi:hypothetical protein